MSEGDVEAAWVEESLDGVPSSLTPEEEEALDEALASLDRGEGADLGEVAADLNAIIRRWAVGPPRQ